MNITIRQLKVFQEVAKLQSFTLASKALYLTQPAVSMQIKQLEEAVGLKLFDKQGRQISLTDAGDEIRLLSDSILQQIDETQHQLEQISSGERGKLRLAVATTVASVATRLMARFNEQHPAMTLHFTVTNRNGLIQLLENNETDIVIMGLNLVSLARLERRFDQCRIRHSPEHSIMRDRSFGLSRGFDNEPVEVFTGGQM
jgi:DNA-binding transcriptional LysR family regulator